MRIPLTPFRVQSTERRRLITGLGVGIETALKITTIVPPRHCGVGMAAVVRFYLQIKLNVTYNFVK